MGRPRIYDGTAAARMRAFRARGAARRATMVATRCIETTENHYQCRRSAKVFDFDGGRCRQHDDLMRFRSCWGNPWDQASFTGICRTDHGEETHDEWRARTMEEVRARLGRVLPDTPPDDLIWPEG